MQDEFPAAKNICWLNSASQGLLPVSSAKAMNAAALRQTAPLPDSDYYDLPARCRQLIAELHHCSPDEIALTSSTGFGLAAVALSLPLGAGEEVLLQEQDFPTNTFTWENLGARIRRIPFAADDQQIDRL